MHCDDVRLELFSFQLGACEEPIRDQVDRHLLDCRACLEQFLCEKRNCESAAAFDARPSPSARAQIFSSMRTLGLATSYKRRGLAVVGLALAAAMALTFLVARSNTETSASPLPPASPQGSLVDSSSADLTLF